MTTLYDFTLSHLLGGDLPLSQFEGKVLLVVNVASQCGLTPQYRGLQAVYEKYADRGLVILGIPCNQFMAQEPGSPEEIQSFCETNYSVNFPMAGKIAVNGEDRAPLYQWLAGENAAFSGDITWNFEKFLIDRNGNVVERFSPKTEPDAEEIITAIENLL